MIQLVTDSAANIPNDLRRRFDVAVVPIRVHFGDETFREGIDLSTAEFFERLETSDDLPMTTPPPPEDFATVYQSALDANHEIVSLHLSGELGGTYESAVQAASQFEDAPISVIDTRSVSSGQALMVVTAARAVQAGLDREEVVTQIKYLRRRTSLLFVLDTLEYLRRGGRIGRAGAFLGTMLRIKPVLQIRNGIIEPVDRISGRKRALERLIDIVYERYADGSVWVGIGEVAAEADAAMLREATTEQLKVEYTLQSSIGPVVATHAGPGTVGVAVSPAPAFEQ